MQGHSDWWAGCYVCSETRECGALCAILNHLHGPIARSALYQNQTPRYASLLGGDNG